MCVFYIVFCCIVLFAFVPLKKHNMGLGFMCFFCLVFSCIVLVAFVPLKTKYGVGLCVCSLPCVLFEKVKNKNTFVSFLFIFFVCRFYFIRMHFVIFFYRFFLIFLSTFISAQFQKFDVFFAIFIAFFYFFLWDIQFIFIWQGFRFCFCFIFLFFREWIEGFKWRGVRGCCAAKHNDLRFVFWF